MEKDYITRVQKQYESYYEKAFNTQVAIVSTLAVFISIVLWIAARFGFQTFDRRIDTALREISTQLRTEFTQLSAKETQALREANSAQLKALEDGLTKRITQQQDLTTRSEEQLQFIQALGFHTNHFWDSAIKHYRHSLVINKVGAPQNIDPKHLLGRIVSNLFEAIRDRDKGKFAEAAKQELKLDLYKDLEDALNFAANGSARARPTPKGKKGSPQLAPGEHHPQPSPAPPADLRAAAPANLRAGHLPAVISPDNGKTTRAPECGPHVAPASPRTPLDTKPRIVQLCTEHHRKPAVIYARARGRHLRNTQPAGVNFHILQFELRQFRKMPCSGVYLFEL